MHVAKSMHNLPSDAKRKLKKSNTRPKSVAAGTISIETAPKILKARTAKNNLKSRSTLATMIYLISAYRRTRQQCQLLKVLDAKSHANDKPEFE